MGGDYGFAWNPHGDYARELSFFTDYVGLSTLDTLVCASRNGAEIMGLGDEIGSIEGITKHVTGGQTAGLTYETIDYLVGVVQMDRLDDDYVVVVMDAPDSGGLNLLTIETP
jgi:hypothetical protein